MVDVNCEHEPAESVGVFFVRLDYGRELHYVSGLLDYVIAL
jgi:hypothetical protein